MIGTIYKESSLLFEVEIAFKAMLYRGLISFFMQRGGYAARLSHQRFTSNTSSNDIIIMKESEKN
ncbi:MAG: hypothetical protein FWG10_05970 [Eubacteriaceae bacterium]|nr:hypothetical protein [Eubacteriaceae bacterium]